MNAAQRFLLWCANASPELLAKCPTTDTLKQVILGTFVLLTGIIAGLGSLYAFYSSTRSILVSAVCAALWAILIFTLDRLVISTITTRQNGNTYTLSGWQAVPRAILAALIGVTIALPVELFIFRDEILQANLEKHEIINIQYQRNDLAARKEAQSEIEGRCSLKVGSLQLAALVKQMENLQIRIDTTIRGKDGTGETCGPVCRDLMAQKERLRIEHSGSQTSWTACIAEEIAQQRGNPETERVAKVRQRLREQTDQAALNPSFLTQYKELRQLAKNNDEVERATIFLPLLFVFFELVPVLAKVIAGVSKYELLTYRERSDAVDGAAEHALGLEAARKHRAAEHDRSQELLAHQRTVATELHKTIDSETAAHFLARFRAILPIFDHQLPVIAAPADHTSLEQAVIALLRRKVDSLITLYPAAVPPIFSYGEHQATWQQAAAPSGMKEATEVGAVSESASKQSQPSPPQAAKPPERSDFAPADATRTTAAYSESFIRKSLEAVAAKTPDALSYLFTNSAAFIAGFPAVLIGISSVTGWSVLALFPLVLGAFVLGRRLAKVHRLVLA